MELTPRKKKILASVIRNYCASGEPVGSKSIAEEIGFSSATVRNEMADLINLGLLEQPHTSAGRIPSQQGLREYLNSGIEREELPSDIKDYIDRTMTITEYDREKVLQNATEALAGALGYASAATSPGGQTAKIKAVQFVQISRRAAMLILMSSAGTMKSRIFRCEFDLTNEIMRIFFRIFNEKLAGKTVAEITPGFIQSLGISFGDMAMLMSSPLMALLETARETGKPETVSAGLMNLLMYEDYSQVSVRTILKTLGNSDDLDLLLTCRPGQVNTLVGTEIGRPEFRGSSIVMSRYMIDGVNAGAIAAVGPMRMNYPLVTECVRYVSERVGEVFTMLTREDL